MADFMSVAPVAAPIVAAVVGYFGKRALDLKPRVVAFIASANSVTVGKNGQTPVQVNSHVLIIRNDGGLAAENVRVLHDFFPADYSVYPGLEFAEVPNPQGAKELKFPTIVPGQQVTISYIYYPPLTWQNVGCSVVSQQGQVKLEWALPKAQPTLWQNWLRYSLMFMGGWAFIYWTARALYAAIHNQPMFGIF